MSHQILILFWSMNTFLLWRIVGHPLQHFQTGPSCYLIVGNGLLQINVLWFHIFMCKDVLHSGLICTKIEMMYINFIKLIYIISIFHLPMIILIYYLNFTCIARNELICYHFLLKRKSILASFLMASTSKL